MVRGGRGTCRGGSTRSPIGWPQRLGLGPRRWRPCDAWRQEHAPARARALGPRAQFHSVSTCLTAISSKTLNCPTKTLDTKIVEATIYNFHKGWHMFRWNTWSGDLDDVPHVVHPEDSDAGDVHSFCPSTTTDPGPPAASSIRYVPSATQSERRHRVEFGEFNFFHINIHYNMWCSL
jgi:hypothetical protein